MVCLSLRHYVKEVCDYRTDITGITAETLEAAPPFKWVRRRILDILSVRAEEVVQVEEHIRLNTSG